MSEPSEKAKAPYLLPEDALAYERFLDWSLGGGFKLALIERRHPEERKALVAWTLERVPGAKVAHLEEGDWMRGQIEAACGGEKAGEVPLLIVAGLEDAAERERACAQLNVERDELARDFGIPWVLITHPAAVLELQQRAPDFCDFVGLWLGDSGGVERIEVPRLAMEWKPLGDHLPAAKIAVVAQWAPDELLTQAQDAYKNGQIDIAADRLETFKLRHPGAKESHPLWIELEGDLLASKEQWEKALSCFEQAAQLYENTGIPAMASAMWSKIADRKAEQGDMEHAFLLNDRAMMLAQTAQSADAMAIALVGLAKIAMMKGESEKGRMLLLQSMQLMLSGVTRSAR